MSISLLHWGLVSFMIGIFLSLPLAAVVYDQSPPWTRIFANPRKLKSAHIDFFMQALAAGFAYVLEHAADQSFPPYILYPLLYGTIGNPLILLLESTAIYRTGGMRLFYRALKATSPIALLLAWTMIAWSFLPVRPLVFLLAFLAAGSAIVWRYGKSLRA